MDSDFEAIPPLPYEDGLPEKAPVPASKLGRPLVAWLAIICLLVAFFIGQYEGQEKARATGAQESTDLIVAELQARALIGAAHHDPEHLAQFRKQIKALDRGGVQQKIRYAIVVGELDGPDEAIDVLENLDRDPDDLRDILLRLYRDYASRRWQAPVVSAAEESLLKRKLGWYGMLALHPAAGRGIEEIPPPAGAEAAGPGDPERAEVLAEADQTFMAIVSALGLYLFVAFAGLVGLIVFLSLLHARRLSGGLEPTPRGGAYAETFALWLALFVGLHGALALFPWKPGMLVNGLILSVGSLVALLWPRARGVSWEQVRQDIGWTIGRGPVREALSGIACYGMTLPLVVVGLALTWLLISLRHAGALLADQEVPVHPIVEFFAHGDLATRIQLVFLACVVAPVVEETMFRGVLYRHLRDLTAAWPWLLSVILAGTVVSFLFAVVHPQGFITVPVLMALAYGFATAREWRGSLIPCMFAHALHNGLLVLLLSFMLKSAS